MMFTGDNLEVAKKVAKEIGINDVKAEMLPTDKYSEIEKIIKNKKNGNVAFVGDGINDSPVLALSDIGISMGGIGASSAIEASDIKNVYHYDINNDKAQLNSLEAPIHHANCELHLS